MDKVRRGNTFIMILVTGEEGIFVGVKPSAHGGTANEALIPIRAQHGVLGAICLGRNGSSGFNQRDVAALDELGSIAGVAVENSRILQAVTGQASKLDTALDALGEVSQALTTVTQGSRVLEQKTLETAVRVTGATAGLLTRSTPEGNQSVIMSVGFPSAVNGLEFQNGQGIVGAVMLRGKATVVQDISASFELRSPPNLVQLGIHAAICMPMLEDGRLWGTLSVFDVKKREWTTDDNRVLATLGNQGVVAVRNAELYDNNQRSIWELRNLQEALQAATSTLDLNQVLQQVLAGAAKASSAQIGCLALDESGKLILKGGFGTDSSTAEKLALGVGGDICRDVMASGKPFMEAMERDTITDSPLNPRAVLCVPITLRGTPTGKLTDDEFAKMKEHPIAGFNILSGLKMLTDELVIVRSHHERYDGKGYPDRKKGDELPMFAWIMSAADAIDAMTSDRPYRKASSLEVAVEQVRAGAGSHFHPDVAEAVLDAAHNGTMKVIPQESLYKDAPTIGAFENPTS